MELPMAPYIVEQYSNLGRIYLCNTELEVLLIILQTCRRNFSWYLFVLGLLIWGISYWTSKWGYYPLPFPIFLLHLHILISFPFIYIFGRIPILFRVNAIAFVFAAENFMAINVFISSVSQAMTHTSLWSVKTVPPSSFPLMGIS